jgi:8-oxo-dGTP pyrophosphatase MutT (NUDIX family)
MERILGAFLADISKGGESFSDCAIRETQEETGLEIEPVEEIPLATNDIFEKRINIT